MINIYVKPGCIQCKMTIRYLNEHNLKFQVHDISQDAPTKQHVLALNYQATPVVETPSKNLSGFRPNELKKLQ